MWSPPYEYVYEITASKIHEYIGVDREALNRWSIVGGYLGYEIPEILKQYPGAKIDIFECSKRYLSNLESKFGENSRVRIVPKAVTKESGFFEFFETSAVGSGSLLRKGKLATQFYGIEQAESFEVESVSLDDFYADFQDSIDVLQIDVQGAEMLVLEGSEEVLKVTKSIFVEVSQLPDLYESAAIFSDLRSYLEARGFYLALLGLDTNLTGNALFIKSSIEG